MLGNEKDIRICFVGDSFVHGTGDPEYLGWTGRVCAAIQKHRQDITYYNLGVRGETSGDITNRWFWEVIRRLPEGCDGRIVFSFGTNDMALEHGRIRIDLPYSIGNARGILDGAKQRYSVLMVGPAPVADERHNIRLLLLSEQYAQLCDDLKVPYLDVLAPLRESNTWMGEVRSRDGHHPGADAYAEYARLVENWSGWQAWFQESETTDAVGIAGGE
jgi:lysophospholipase L1-like esterase